MPYKTEKMKLPPELDRRRKISNEQKEEIKHKYASGLYSLNKLAKEYEVSKKLILITVNSESRRKSEEYIKEHWRDYRPDKAEWAAIMREHRAYKNRVLKENKED